MPRIPSSLFARVGRGARSVGAAIRPAVPLTLGVGALSFGTSQVLKQAAVWRQAGRPGLKSTSIDVDGRPGAEGLAVVDPVTGRILSYGIQPTYQSGPERSQERETKTLLLVLGAAAVAAIVVFGRRA